MVLVKKNQSIKKTVQLPSELESLEKIEKISEEISEEAKLSSNLKDNLAIAVTEVVGNAIVHGNHEDPDKTVSIDFEILEDRVIITVKDQGKGFNPDCVEDCLDPENLMKESGRGIFILRSLMDDLQIKPSENGTTVEMMMLKK